MPTDPAMSERKRARILFDQVRIDEIKALPYWEEILGCALSDYRRASYVLLWCAIVDSLYLRVNGVGFDFLAQAYQKQFQREVKNLDELRRLPSSEFRLIDGLAAARMITEEQRKQLQDYREIRNKCAHASPLVIDRDQLLSLFEFAVNQFWSRIPCGSLPLTFFAEDILDPVWEYDAKRVEGILPWLKDDDSKELAELAEKLITKYCDENFLDIRDIQNRILFLWSKLSSKFNNEQKREINQKLAELARSIENPAKIVLYPLVFWEQLVDIQQHQRSALLTYITKWEFVETDEEKMRERKIDYDSVVVKIVANLENAKPQSAEECRALSQKFYDDELTKGASQ